MKKILLVCLLLFCSSSLFAQGTPQLNQQRSLTATGASDSRDVRGQGLGYYKVTWSVQQGTVSACTFTLQKSPDNVTWTDVGSANTCTSAGQISPTAFVSNYVRINVSAFTASSGGTPTLVVNVIGWSEITAASAGTGTSSTFGAALPATGTASGFQANDGTMAAGLLDASGFLKVNVAAGGAGGGAVTQSGIWNITNVSGTVSLPTGASTSAKQAALGTAGTASTDVLSIQGIASMTKLLVTPDSVALPANQSVNVAQINGVTTLMGNGASGTGAQRVTIANDSTGVIGLSTGTNTIGSVKITDGTTIALTDPCSGVAKTFTPISMTTATTTRFIAPTSAKKTYICSLVLFSAGTDNVAIVEGTGGTCGTGTAGVIGGTTAANGLNLVAQTGIAWGDGRSAIFATAGTNVDFCLITSAAVVLAGHVSWVQQ